MRTPVAITTALLAFAGAAPSLALDSALAQVFPEVSLPPPTGPHAIGRRTLVIVDSSRVERVQPDSGGPRVLRVRLWYPAAETAGPNDRYMDPPTAATWVERHDFPPGFEERVGIHAREDAPLAASDSAWPLVLFSHGMSWPAAMYQTFLEEMASHGYVVAAIDHTGYSDAIVFPDGRLVGFTAWTEQPTTDAERRARLAAHMPTWVDDLETALDEIERRTRNGEPFFESIAVDRVGAFGHSYGGGAAVRLMQVDPRVVAAANLDGGAYGPDSLPFRVSEPLLHVVGGYNEAELVATEFEPDDAPLYEVLVQGAFHSTFSDLIYLHAFKADPDWHARHRYDLDPARALRITSDFLRAFFDRYVIRIDGEREDLLHLRSSADLLGASTRGYPEVVVRIDF
ncbi:MAG TPA: alpha/beta hydrolase [Gemmatimonadota bacterium]|nr:alpha/beta hydrolase [Gemmatimonadota bacterium]